MSPSTVEKEEYIQAVICYFAIVYVQLVMSQLQRQW